ncbi:MAG TPA: sensor histidine kinase, partial [Myxococcaceae bacterium]|nr:sensor histidine kinase [Myxococcaceae bacterium]
MKLSLATRIFLGYAVVLVTFGAVSLFSVAELHRNQQEIRLVSQGYLQLSQEAAALDSFHTNQEKDTERLLEEDSAETRRALIRLARLYYPSLMAQKLEDAKTRAQEVRELAPAREVAFVQELESRFGELAHRYQDYGRAAEAVYTVLATESPGPEELASTTAELRQQEAA